MTICTITSRSTTVVRQTTLVLGIATLWLGVCHSAVANSRGYLTTPQELVLTKQKADQGIEPYKTAVSDVLLQASQSWDFILTADTTCGNADDPLWNDNQGGTPILYAKALAYHLTGDPQYAEEAKNILQRIMTEVQTISIADDQCQLNFGWGTPEIVASADLIEDYWAGQSCTGPTSTVYGQNTLGTGTCKVMFQNWLAKNPYYVVSEATAQRTGNNWGAAATDATMYIADYLQDRPTLQLVHRNPRQVNGGNNYVFTPAESYAYIKDLTLQRMRMQSVTWTSDSCDNLQGPMQSPNWAPVKSGITENGIVTEDAARDEYCNIPQYDGVYHNYPELHLGNLIQQCELMRRRGDNSCFDNVDNTDVPNYTFTSPDNVVRTTHLYPGRGSLERAIDAIIIDAGAEWNRGGTLWVAYSYYLDHKRLSETDLSKWATYLANGAGNCQQDVCFGGLTHGFPISGTTGTSPGVSLSTSKLNFGDQTVGGTSAPLSVTLTNSGNATLTITSILTNGDFSQTNSCGTSVGAGSNCTLSVTFTPSATGSRIGTLTIRDNASSSPQTVSLSGNGVTTSGTPIANLSQTQISFKAQRVSTTSDSQPVTLSNSGDGTLNISGITISTEFGQTNNCGTTVPSGGTCTLSITFRPTQGGRRTGTLTIKDNASGSPHTVSLGGTGKDFSTSGSPKKNTVKRGETATYTLTVTPQGGFNETVSLSCSGGPQGSTCKVSPSSVTLDGVNPVTTTVTFQTAAGVLLSFQPSGFPTNVPRRSPPLWLLCTSGLAILILASSRTQPLRRISLTVAAVLLALITWTACGGGGLNSTAGGASTGSYTLTLTGTSAGLDHSDTVTVAVE
jgi:hypothetical protein